MGVRWGGSGGGGGGGGGVKGGRWFSLGWVLF